MGEKLKIEINGLPASKSFSLREDNVRVAPTYFDWVQDEEKTDLVFYRGGHIRKAKRNTKRTQVAILTEPPHLHPENYHYIEDNWGIFDWVLTYDQFMLDNVPNSLYYALGGSSVAFHDWNLYPKKKDICMIASGKKTMPGHQMRVEILKRFKDKIDVYGDAVGKPFDRKFDILREYKYCLVVESEKADHYFSEKLIDAISVGCIPLHWCNRSNHSTIWFQKHNFTKFDELDSLFILARNNQLNFTQAQLEYNLESAKRFAICEDWIYLNRKELFNADV